LQVVAVVELIEALAQVEMAEVVVAVLELLGQQLHRPESQILVAVVAAQVLAELVTVHLQVAPVGQV
jgi:hypothetical protein